MEQKNKKKKKTLTFINTNPQLTNSVVEGSAVARDRVSAKISSIIEKRKEEITRQKAHDIARGIMRNKFANDNGQEYATMAPSDKVLIDKLIDDKVDIIHKLVDKIYPGIKKEKASVAYVNPGNKKEVKKSQLATQFANFSEKTENALIRKSENTGISLNILREVYHRGYNDTNKKMFVTQEQNGFNRVNSFIQGGKARVLDKDLFEKKNKKQIGFIETKPKIPAAEAQAPDTKIFIATSNAMSEQQDVWDKPNPVKNSKKLSPEQKAKAKARAKAAGRPYPNMVDNIAVARTNESLIKTIKSQLKVIK